MARGSEGFAWRLFGVKGADCTGCGVKLTVKAVAHHRVRYPGGRVEFFCRSCSDEMARRAA